MHFSPVGRALTLVPLHGLRAVRSGGPSQWWVSLTLLPPRHNTLCLALDAVNHKVACYPAGSAARRHWLIGKSKQPCMTYLLSPL